ncbi:MAG TPA: hypothetical protein VFV38_36710 [Ktedonobacteraceae bacterium]|nr:hypothetical protein [Ktedonobacteraceae bacterium]
MSEIRPHIGLKDKPIEAASAESDSHKPWLNISIGTVLGLAILLIPTTFSPLSAPGWQPLGPLIGIALIVFSLFGDLPSWISWTQRLGAWLFPGLALGTVILLIPLLIPHNTAESSLLAFSPSVWAAYISIVLVSISFEHSLLPERIYRYCYSQPFSAAMLIPLYVVVAGLLGNIFDGVSIIAISVVIFRKLLDRRWAFRASFALLFGGLISNLITVAAEPTNIKFQDVLHTVLDRVFPPFWITNWPISLLGILLPTIWLAGEMWLGKATWRIREETADPFAAELTPPNKAELPLSILSMGLLAAGIIAHSIAEAITISSGETTELVPLWVFLLPAGITAAIYLVTTHHTLTAGKYISEQWPVWGKLMVIFSLLWFLSNALTQSTTISALFFTWPEFVRYPLMIILSLLSSITDNVALAAMQGALIVNNPLSIWQIRLLFILLTWSGGFTPFGCLQSLALNSRLKLSTGEWFRQTFLWSALAIIGGLLGLALIGYLYPVAVSFPH